MKTVRARIDLGALRHNVRLIGEKNPGRKIYSVVKANAYGHGSVPCARALRGLAHGFAVARIEEAAELREAGITEPILLLGGIFRKEDLAAAAELGLEFCVHSDWQIEALAEYPARDAFTVWLQVNVGMERLGFDAAAPAARRRLESCRSVRRGFGMISHLSCADDPALAARNAAQLAAWEEMTRDFPGPLSLSNSAACLYFPEKSTAFIRPGITQYGISPTAGRRGAEFGFRPVMRLSTVLTAVRDLKPGDAVGYGASWVCERPTRIGIAAAGYADGYPRAVPNGTPVEINGRVARTAGHVCMDMMFIDLGPDSRDRVGDAVYLWGTDKVTAEEIAESVGTIPYELACRLTSRVRYEYTE